MIKTDPAAATESGTKYSHTQPLWAQDVFDKLDALGLNYRTLKHEAVFTVEASKAIKTDMQGQGCKCLFLKDKKEGRLWLVGTLDDKRVDLKELSNVLGCGRFSFASAERLMAHLGVIPGSVTVFAVINDPDATVQLVLDAELLDKETVNFHPLQNDMTTNIKPDDLVTFCEACGHKPLIIKVPTAQG